MPPTNDGYGLGWGSSFQDLTLGSGAKCMVRKLQMEDLSELGIIDHIDMLQDIVQEDHVDRVKKPQDRQKKKPTKADLAKQEAEDNKRTMDMMRDKAKFGKMADMIEKIVVAVVVKPQILSAYKDVDGERVRLGPDERTGGVIYSDTIAFQDKMEIFQYAFEGVSKLSDFREGSAEDVGDVVDVEESPMPS